MKFPVRLSFKLASLVAALFCIGVVIPAFGIAPVAPSWAPEFVRNWAYDMRLLLARPMITVMSLYRAASGDLTIFVVTEEIHSFIISDGLRIAATIKKKSDSSSSKSPGILLLHGSTPKGRLLGLYRILMEKLVTKGFVVLAIDLRGFGQSDDPPDLRKVESFNFTRDVQNAISHLRNMPEVDPGRIFMVGHSYGADVALQSAAQGVLINKLVLIGPGRRTIERGGSADSREFDYFRRRDMRYMSLRSPIPVDVFLRYRQALSIENQVGFFDRDKHIPVLFMDSECESDLDKIFLNSYVRNAGGAVRYVTIGQADHYLNVGNIGPLIFYDRRAVDQAVEAIDAFLTRS